MAAHMMSCCSTALLSRVVVIRPHCIHRHIKVGVSLYGAELREEQSRIQQHRTIRCSSASSPNSANEVQIQLFNTVRRQKEFFQSLVLGKVSMYLKSVGFDVTYVRNYTDTDEKVDGL